MVSAASGCEDGWAVDVGVANEALPVWPASEQRMSPIKSIYATAGPGPAPVAAQRMRTVTPTLAARLADVETGLAGSRAALVEDYARWTRALDDLENIWALAAWRSAAEEPLDAVSRLAA